MQKYELDIKPNYQNIIKSMESGPFNEIITRYSSQVQNIEKFHQNLKLQKVESLEVTGHETEIEKIRDIFSRTVLQVSPSYEPVLLGRDLEELSKGGSVLPGSSNFKETNPQTPNHLSKTPNGSILSSNYTASKKGEEKSLQKQASQKTFENFSAKIALSVNTLTPNSNKNWSRTPSIGE